MFEQRMMILMGEMTTKHVRYKERNNLKEELYWLLV